MQFVVYRFRPGMDQPRYDRFRLDPVSGETVLSALFRIQETLDDSLAFRYSCRGAVCGTCAMLINRVPRLACRTQVAALLEGKAGLPLSHFAPAGMVEPWDPKKEVIVEPLPNLPVIKDLIVNMDRFFAYYREISPVFRPSDPAPVRERSMSPAAVRELDRYTTCILCAACFGACPVNGQDPAYLGPAALAKLWRFRIDPREDRGEERLASGDRPDGWWACRFHTNCRRVCPKDVTPDRAIGKARMELSKRKKEKEP
ncbi:MAG TPA: succinate dehydrogenase/fumarate reductase iron-sulfur subunit [Methanoregula sp.]|nr:succinate dehydrogenase/fumarate reductase iron-sulfur subunit [Methanoregula sp.]